jgi:hypothetical protein
VRAAPVLLAVVLGLAAGCAGGQWIYSKKDVTPATLDSDLGGCRRQAHRPHSFALMSSRRVDQDELNRCMERKGYKATRDE